jgi:glyoxylase-like metal-dependent hydrolase (beta-lactamase superfamily II)
MILTFTPSVSADDGPFIFEFEELAPGVWAGVRADSPRFPVMGNITFVISEEGVVVYDGGGMPAMSEQAIKKIRSLTSLAVTHVVTSHWHGDHNFGIYRFAEEFKNVKFIAHEFTREVMNSSRINYVDRERGFVEENFEEFQKIVKTGMDSKGNEVSKIDRDIYKRIIADRDVIDKEFLRAKVTPPNVVFSDKYLIKSGTREIELLHLGHANTEGDIIMWLPKEKIISTGDIVVFPSPYAFNSPPRSWVKTLRNINNLGYKILVPGHGAIQRDTSYVDLLIESVESIADQRDVLLAEGKSKEEIQPALDLSLFEERFTQGDDYILEHFKQWFERPIQAAAMKALTGEPMVKPPPAEKVPFDDPRWKINAKEYEITDYLGQVALKIKGGEAMLPDTDIKNGLIEFDIAITKDRGFAGLVFREQDKDNYEHFYVRPHQSGKLDANQYTPVFNGVSGWQLYYGKNYATAIDYRYNEWMHIKIIFAGSQAQIHIDSDEPVLQINNLRRKELSGAIGVNSANFSSVHFANFQYTNLANAYAIPKVVAEPLPTKEGMIVKWQVSDTFDEKRLIGKTRLSNKIIEERNWNSLNAESTGITNIATIAKKAENKNTVFVKHTINSDGKNKRLLTFGYSDRASVYLNNTLIYKGNNGYMSRDYRYLGTIGLFDSVILPLNSGDNELWIAVSDFSRFFN